MNLCRSLWVKLVLMLAVLPCFASHARSKQILVDDDRVECPAATFTSIQAAVNAASAGDQIIVCKGVYSEQVVITKALSIDASNGAILMPSAMQTNSASLFDGSPLAVALLVTNTTEVTIEGLIVDGSNSGILECAPDFFGIAFQNASGSIQRTTVRNFKLVSSPSGCQNGTGIFVQSGGGLFSNVWIGNNSVHDFQKNGITANEMNTEVFVRSNVVVGSGPTNGTAQNGIQLGFGATGRIQLNTVTNTVWAPCTDVETCTAVATGILVTQSDNVVISENIAGVSQVPIFVNGNSAQVRDNNAFSAFVFDAVRLEGSQDVARGNTIFNASESGVFIDGNNNVVRDNTITDASIGILKTVTSSGTLIQGNSIYNTLIRIQDPPARSIASLVSPKR